MEVTALCFTLMVELLVLLVDPRCFAALPRVRPDRLQFFEYDNVTVDCAEFSGSTEWRVMRKLNQTQPKRSVSWNSSSPSVSIKPPFKSNSGAYWCEDAEGRTSDALSITLTDGSVILDVPARPVKDGDHLVLHCKNKDSKNIADFYRDGSHLGTQYDATLTLPNISQGDAGLYWCSVSGAGTSPQSRLGVRKQAEAADEETGHWTPTTPTHPNSTHPPVLPTGHFPLLGVVVGVLVGASLLLLGGLLLRRNRGVSGQEAVDQDHGTYAVVQKKQKKQKKKESPAGDQDHGTYAVVQEKQKKQKKKESPAGDQDHGTYAVVQKKQKKKESRAGDQDHGTYAVVQKKQKKKSDLPA